MFLNPFATRLRRLAAGLAMTFCLTLAAGEALSDTVKPVISLEFYVNLLQAAKQDKDHRIELLIVNEGLLDGVLTVHQAYNSMRVPRRICPEWGTDFNYAGPFFRAIAEEMKANAKYYDPMNAADMGEVALFALQRRFPCN